MNNKSDQNKKRYLLVGAVFVSGLLLRIVLSVICKGYQGDINNFTYWSDMAYREGLSSFYKSDVFNNCTPGNVYIFYIIGAIRKLFHVSSSQAVNLLIIKLPAILCDILTAGMIYRVIKDKCKYPCGLTLLYLLNPAIWLTSVVWGQYDSIVTFFLLLIGYLVWKKKIGLSYLAFGAALLFNLNVLLIAPILLVATYVSLVENKEWVKGLVRNIIYLVFTLIMFVLVSTPFGLREMIHKYIDIKNQYHYTSMNAFNIWNLFDLNLISNKDKILSISFEQLGNIGLLFAIIMGLIVYIKGKDKDTIFFFSTAVTVLLSYIFSTNIKERYLYPCIVILFVVYLYEQKKQWITCYVLFSIAYTINLIAVMVGDDYTVIYTLGSVFLLSLSIYFMYYVIRSIYVSDNYRQIYSIRDFFHIEKRAQTITSSCQTRKFNKKDYIAIIGITTLYAFIAFYDLGGRVVPTTYQILTGNTKSITVDTGKETNLKTISVYLGESRVTSVKVEQANEPDGTYSFVCEETLKGIFKWTSIELTNTTSRYYRVTATSDKVSFGEMVLFDDLGNYIEPIVDDTNTKLFDEQDTYQDGYDKDNSAYFDEIYYARTVYNMENGQPWYESTHPPLGKIIMALGVKLFGLNPFGWRFMGNIFGILMVPLCYIIVNRLFKRQLLNIILTIIFSFDFMHFVQTRLATIDVFVTFFIMAMYYFMMVYCDMSFYDKKLSKTLIPLGLSGICMGFAFASKWTGIYAGAGLAVIFFRQMWIRFRERDMVEDSRFYYKFCITVLYCIVFFIVIPAGIYIASYIPFRDNSSDGLILRMINNQKWMFHYHSTLKATHSFSSKWYQWPLMDRPIFYYSRVVKEGVKEGISAFGNPLVWWTGIIAAVWTLWLSIKKRDRVGGMIFIGYLSQLLPWVLITRCTFIYHYFPSVIFVVLMIGYCMKQLLDKYAKIGKKVIIVYTVFVVGLFALFYPVLSGQPVSTYYVQWYLRWFSSWVLV